MGRKIIENFDLRPQVGNEENVGTTRKKERCGSYSPDARIATSFSCCLSLFLLSLALVPHFLFFLAASLKYTHSLAYSLSHTYMHKCTNTHTRTHTNTQVLQQLMENGASVNVFDRSGITPLHYAGLFAYVHASASVETCLCVWVTCVCICAFEHMCACVRVCLCTCVEVYVCKFVRVLTAKN